MKGFLPIDEPLQGYSSINENSLTKLQELATNLPKLLLTDRLETNIRMMSDHNLCVYSLILLDIFLVFPYSVFYFLQFFYSNR